MKRCRICGETKALDEFHERVGMRDGRRSECKDCRNAYKNRWRSANPELNKAQEKRFRVRHPERSREVYARNKVKVFAHYGTVCACCGVTEDLTIDHIHGDGAALRREIGNGNWYWWLLKEGLPEGFQALCQRCNSSKWTGPVCRLHSSPPKPVVDPNPVCPGCGERFARRRKDHVTCSVRCRQRMSALRRRPHQPEEM